MSGTIIAAHEINTVGDDRGSDSVGALHDDWRDLGFGKLEAVRYGAKPRLFTDVIGVFLE